MFNHLNYLLRLTWSSTPHQAKNNPAQRKFPPKTAFAKYVCLMQTALKILFIILSVASPGALLSQTNEGNEFWFGFMHHYDPGQNEMVAMITSKYNTSGVVSIPAYNWQQTFNVGANAVTIIHLPSYVENTSSEIPEERGVRVVSQLPVSVYTHQYYSMRSEATVVLPVSSLGMEYYAMTYNGYQEGGEVFPSGFLLVGVEDGTEVTVTVSDKTKGGKAAGDTFTVVLDAGDTYQVQSLAGSSGDLTGSHASGNKKFNVFAGCRWTQVPVGCNYRDNLLEQMYPVATWGRQFVTAPFAHMPYDLFRILAAEDNTEVTVQAASGTQQYTLDAGEFVQYNQSEPTYINASQPVAVVQYLIGSACSGYPVGDPSMVFLNSVEQIRDTVTMYNSAFEAISEKYITVITKTADLSLTTFDGQPLSDFGGSIATAGPGDVFSLATLKVNTGAHTIISQGCGVIATAYGYGNVESYAYGGGASFKPLNAQSLIPEGGCLNDTLFFDTKLPEPRYSFLWDLGDGATSTEAAFSHVYSSLGAYKVTLYLTDNCLDLYDTLSREVLITLRQAAAVSGDADLCTGETIQLGVTDLPGARFEWTGPDGFFSTEQYPVLSNAQPTQSGEYSVVGIISGCATYPSTAEVTVHPTPQPDLGADFLICPDDLGDTLPTLYPGDYALYTWQNNSHTPVLEVREGGLYWVQVTDEYGCTASDSLSVREICPTRYYIPNVFSPNDDGGNDYFEVYGRDIISLWLSVYDRWGNHLFESTDVAARWDGTFRGKPVNPGVYTWVARIEGYRKDGTVFKTVERGSLTVVR